MYSFNVADSSSIAPTVSPNQSGGSNRIQSTAAESIFPFTNQGDGSTSPLVILAVIGAVCFLGYIIFRK